MANFYCDISAIGNEYQAYADTPTTWAVPQDGNGKAGPGHTAAVAICTIDVAGCTGTSASVGVMGVSLTGLNGTGAALATAIAAAVNASATAVSATYSALLLPLNKLVYARVNPGLSTQVQIMLRIAGTDWVGFTPTQASIAPAATISNFAGGANGPFGYFGNNTAVFGKIHQTYGMFVNKSAGPTEPGANDLIHVRTKRSGANLTQVLSDAYAGFSASYVQHNFRYDNGTIWSGDNGVFTYQITATQNGGQTNSRVGAGMHECAVPYNFVFSLLLTGTGGRYRLGGVTHIWGRQTQWRGVKFEERVGTAVVTGGLLAASVNATDQGGSGEFIDCWFSYQAPRRIIDTASAYAHFTRMLNCKFSAANMTGKWSQFINASSAGGNNGGILIEMKGCQFDSSNAFTADNPVNTSNMSDNVRIVLDGVTGLDFSVAGITPSAQKQLASFLYVGTGEDRPFRHETGAFIVDWRSDASYPTLNSQLPSGAPWVMRLLWQTVSDFTHSVNPIKLSTFFKASPAINKVEVEVLLADAFACTQAELSVLVRYRDSTDILRHEHTLQPWSNKISGTATAIASSSASWTGLPSGFSPKKLSLTTAYPIKTNTEVTAVIQLHGTPASQQIVYVNPEIQIVPV